MDGNKQVQVYWQSQGGDKLCAVHCVNSLLQGYLLQQGPFFNQIDLANIALEIDQKQGQLLDPTEAQLKKQSNNVALDGNYSIQVIQQAIKRYQQLHLESIDSQLNKQEDMSTQNGFICNSAQHWFAIRKINNVWYNLNSTNREGPEIISDFYLSAFLLSIKENGYHIFVIRGQFPQNTKLYFQSFKPFQKWFTPAQLEAVKEKRMKQKNYVLNIGGTDQRDLQQALKKSMKTYQEQKTQQKQQDKTQQQKNSFKPFIGKGQLIQSIQVPKQYFQKCGNINQDPEMFFIVKQSIKDSFKQQPQQGINIDFIFSKSDLKRRFSLQDTVERLYDFCFACNTDQTFGPADKFLLSCRYPTRNLLDINKTIQQINLDEGQKIYINKR